MRVSLARVLAQETPIILFDEPTASLDVRHQHLVMEVARDFAAGGATVLCILHDLNLALAYADRIAVMAQGRILVCDAPWPVANSGILEHAFACPISVLPHPHRDTPMVVTWGVGARTCFLRHSERNPLRSR
jgi:iron complex transport system ATP-binding protein